jgi:hypothetical protein
VLIFQKAAKLLPDAVVSPLAARNCILPSREAPRTASMEENVIYDAKKNRLRWMG